MTSCIIDRDRRSREDRDAERVETVAAEDRATDTAVLKAMRDHAAATSVRRLRPYLGLRLGVVSDAVDRILCAGLATEGKRGQAYQITMAGHEQLNGGQA